MRKNITEEIKKKIIPNTNITERIDIEAIMNKNLDVFNESDIKILNSESDEHIAQFLYNNTNNKQNAELGLELKLNLVRSKKTINTSNTDIYLDIQNIFKSIEKEHKVFYDFYNWNIITEFIINSFLKTDTTNNKKYIPLNIINNKLYYFLESKSYSEKEIINIIQLFINKFVSLPYIEKILVNKNTLIEKEKQKKNSKF